MKKVIFLLFVNLILCSNQESKMNFQKKQRSHDENRAVLCCACGKKDQKCSLVTPAVQECVKTEIYQGYTIDDRYYPSGICTACRRYLFIARKGDVVPEVVRERWNSMDYESFKRPSRSSPCNCKLCDIARYTGTKLEKKARPDVPRLQPATDEAEATCEQRVKWFFSREQLVTLFW